MDLLDNLSTVLHQSAEKVVLVDLSDLSHFIEAGGRGGGVIKRGLPLCRCRSTVVVQGSPSWCISFQRYETPRTE